ncbi:retrovirus-related Pol polyprotein from transposon TNT 1-94 isoform X2 [Elaeis guineensis]|uniref:retrovirus-related Pol polyprotein from transposon TNT 1-94 isoform X2 n=1 Tax=Elaeis guineensis var. tenera TaxID=51953 RepID=UPI003C6D65BB
MNRESIGHLKKNIEHAFQSKVEITNKSQNGEGTSQQRNAEKGGYHGRGRGRGRSYWNHEKADNSDKAKSNYKGKQCRFYHKYGHIEESCWKKAKQQANFVEEQEQEGCIYGKQHKLSFPVRKSWRAKKLLELIHADICGPMNTPSWNKSRYFLLFIDDYSRMCWMYFLIQKSEAIEKFQKFKAIVEKESEHMIKILRTDRGGEFLCNDFDSFCKKNGIRRQLTVRHTSEQNGVAERKNRTVVEMARSMLQGKMLPNVLWAEAVATSVHLLNISPTKAVRNMTLFEAWYQRKPEMSNLRVFGCIVYAHISFENRSKLDQKSERCISIRYSSESKDYRLYNPLTKKLIIR